MSFRLFNTDTSQMFLVQSAFFAVEGLWNITLFLRVGWLAVVVIHHGK